MKSDLTLDFLPAGPCSVSKGEVFHMICAMIKVCSFTDSSNFLLLILKWGGELTESGRQQAQELGKRFRCMYPGSRDDNSGAQEGLGFLRLHSTYRHDLKIYASDEGRVQTTAAAFAKGLLGLLHTVSTQIERNS